MAELITEDQPRIKFLLRRTGRFQLEGEDASGELLRLCGLMARMEAEGAAPVLNDGKVGGNCAMVASLATARSACGAAAAPPPSAAPTPAAAAATSGRCSDAGDDAAIIVSRSGKAPGAVLAPGDFARVSGFDRSNWGAEFESSADDVVPSSDTPLLWACLSPGACEEYGWERRPRVAFHGHALEQGAGLAAARSLDIPVSDRETLFSTREDLGELEGLLRGHPYPHNRVYIRRGHGFFVLGDDVADVEGSFLMILEAARAARGTGAAGEAGEAEAVQEAPGPGAAQLGAAAAAAAAGAARAAGAAAVAAPQAVDAGR